jgi:hypothetical protein
MGEDGLQSAWLSGRTDPLGRSSSKGHDRELAIGAPFLLVLAGGPLRASPATLLARSRLVGALAGGLALVGAVGGALFGLGALDSAAGPLPGGPLSRVMGLRAEGPVGVGDLVAAPVLLDLSGGLAPDQPAPGRLGHRIQRLQDIAGAVGFDRHAGGPPLPGQGPHHLPVGRAKVGIGFQPTLAALLVLAEFALPIVGAVGLLGGHRQPTWHLGRLVAAAAQPAKHADRLAGGRLLVGGQDFLGLLAVGGGPFELAAAVAGGLVELATKLVPLGPQLRRGQPLEIGAAGGVIARVWPLARDRA